MHQQSNGTRSRIAGCAASHQNGFTLIELMIAVAVVAILAGIVYPSYKEFVYKARRAEAKSALMHLAARQEQYFQNNKQYADALSDLKVAATTNEGGWYTLSVAIPEDDVIDTMNMGFELTATPNGDQSNDKKCGTFRLTHRGLRTVTGSQGATSCW